MRTLVILRGSPGSGKSTWIKKMGLEQYTLCADTIRLLVQSPMIVPDKTYRTISQKNDSYVWQLLFELLDKRMARGEFVVIDATHSRSSDFSRYNKLCERYRYRRYYVDFSDIPIEVCKERNAQREDYKRVPEEVIDKMYSRLRTQDKTSGWVKIDRDKFWEQIGMKLFDMNKYDRINIFGDVHGCYNPLKKYFEEYPYSENEFYIFCGDYLDRGLQNKETLLFLMDMAKKSNVLMLEGNHEKWLHYYAIDELENIHSKTFLHKTMMEIMDIEKSDIRSFYRKIGQVAYFTYDGHRYICSHGGISYLPTELQLVATDQLINGVGDYNVDIDEIFDENMKDTDIIQVHGHRNTFDVNVSKNNKSVNLEGKVEFGGNLKVLQLSKNESLHVVTMQNDYFGTPEEVNQYQECRTKLNIPVLEALRGSRDIKETELGNNISSFNFTNHAFYNKHWNEYTCKARGLFVDTIKDEVVARGYEKFFNVNERREVELEHLLVKFKDQGNIVCYKKENGFLGIMSMVNGELFLASKSTNTGPFADIFKEIFTNSKIDKEKLVNYLQTNNVSLTFEVIDPEKDPHIIKYTEPKIVLLDIIHNKYDFEREPYEEVVKLAESIGCECKHIYKSFDNVRDFHRWYLENTNENDLSKEDIEGVVIECNGIMTKLKFPYYNFWKLMRRVKEQVRHGSRPDLARLYNATANYFYAWAKKQSEETLSKDIITLREQFYKENENG